MRGTSASARALALLLVGVAVLAAGCGGDDDSFDRGTSAADAGPASTGLATDAGPSPTDAATAKAEDASARDASPSDANAPDAAADGGIPLFVQPFVASGPIQSILHVGSSWYLGGAFDRISRYTANNFIAVDPSGTPAGCLNARSSSRDLGSGAILALGTALYVGGPTGIVKMDSTSCAVDPTFRTPTLTVSSLVADASSLYVVTGVYPHMGIAKLDLQSGALDTTFRPSGPDLSEEVGPIFLASGGLYVSGGMSSDGGAPTYGLSKLDPVTGDLDPTFNQAGAGFDQPVRAMAASATSLYVGGQFKRYRGVFGSAADWQSSI